MNTKRLFILLFVSLLLTPIYADKVSLGDWHTVAVTTDGRAWTFGRNKWGALGDGTYLDRYVPTEVMNDVEKVAAGGDVTLFLKKDGRLFGCGSGSFGLEKKDGGYPTPQLITKDVISMSTSGNHTLVLKNDGSVWSCGNNAEGQLGDGTLDEQSELRKVIEDGAIEVVAGGNNSFVIKKDGTLWACGRNDGMLGDGTIDMTSTFIRITENVKKVAIGSHHTLILKKDGTLFGCGDNVDGSLGTYGRNTQLTIPTFIMNDVTDMAATWYSSMVVKNDGTLWVAGVNEGGLLGDGTTMPIDEFKKVADNVSNVFLNTDTFHSMILKKDGSLWSCGYNTSGTLGNGVEGDQLSPLQIMTGVMAVSSQLHHSMVLKTDGSLWSFGLNDNGQLGNGTLLPNSVPISITRGVKQISSGYHHSMFVKNDGSLWGCGLNASGQLGDGTTEDKLSPVKIMDDVNYVSAGGHFSLILKNDGTLWACGSNRYGQLGNGEFYEGATSKPEKIMEDVASVDAGGYHTFIIKKDGALWACGYNLSGELGDGSGRNQAYPVKIADDVAQASAGYLHSLIVKKDGTLWACGDNYFGQLGNSDTKTDQKKPIKVMDDVVQASAAAHNSMVLKSDGSLWTFGRNDHGELGNGEESSLHGVSTPTKVMDNVIQICAGGSRQDGHSMAVTKDHILYAWGSRCYGELGDGRSEVFHSKIMDNLKYINTNIDGVDYVLNDDDKEGLVRMISDNAQVPSTLSYRNDKYIITQIGDSVFKGRTYESSLNSVSFPQTITDVSVKAFDVYGAHSVVWKSNTKLPVHAFDNPLYGKGNFLLYVNSTGIAPSTIDNVVVDGKAESIRLKDGYVFHCPKDFSVGSISYTHNYSMETGINECAGWESIALPFDVQTISHKTKGELVPFANYTKNSGKKGFWLYSLSRNGFIEASAIKANTPYILSMPNNNYYGMDFNLSGDVTFSATNTIVRNTDETNYQYGTYEGAMFYPNYRLLETSNNNFTLNVSNELTTYYGTEKPGSVFISDYRKINPFECYFYKSASGARLLSIPFKDNATGIPTIPLSNDRSHNPIYNLNGQFVTTDQYAEPVKRLPKGTYIVNGRKVVVK